MNKKGNDLFAYNFLKERKKYKKILNIFCKS